MRAVSNCRAILTRSSWNTVHDLCDLNDSIQTFERIFKREYPELQCFVIKRINDAKIFRDVYRLTSDQLLFKFREHSMVPYHAFVLFFCCDRYYYTLFQTLFNPFPVDQSFKILSAAIWASCTQSPM